MAGSIRRGHAARPPVGQGNVARIEQVIVAGGTDFLGIARGTLKDAAGQLGPFGGFFAQRADELGQ